MKVAITGGTGFVGSHFAKSLADDGVHAVVLSRGVNTRNMETFSEKQQQFVEFRSVGTADVEKLTAAFAGCEVVAHCAGINRELEAGDYQRVHVQGTRNVVEAAKQAGVKKLILISFYRARPGCGSKYHESKFDAEEIIRNSGLDYTVLKPGMIYGKGDHMLDHLSHVFHTLPIFGLVGFKVKFASPLAIDDFVRIMKAAAVDGRMSHQTVAMVGPDKLTLEETVKHVARVVGREPLFIPMPITFHIAFAHLLEVIMDVPLIAQAQVRILTEGFDEPAGKCDPLPADLTPRLGFTDEQIRQGLPTPGPFTKKDFRCVVAR